MALFSRKNDSTPSEPTPAPVEEEALDAETSREAAPEVSISLSSYGDALGAPAAPAPAAETPSDERQTLPLAPADPPEDVERTPGMPDNAVLRDALARLSEDPSGEEVLGVARQLLQGHLFLRVKGDAQQQVAAGEPLQLGVVNDGDRTFLLAFSSVEALRAAVEADGDTETSAVSQPSIMVLQHVVESGFAALLLDPSGPRHAIMPRELLEQAVAQADPEITIKSLICAPRTAETVAGVVDALTRIPTWVAVSEVGRDADGDPEYGVAEAHLSDGRRMLHLFTHPLEAVALGVAERPMPFSPEQLAGALDPANGLGGVIVDAGGPSLVLDRAQLGPVLAT